ncbi:hypothetical protein HDU79_009272 [Rhizoclosmatium sp. JEL0117]|nr:hypothetical protein HDU79_009272 [Rhizoclosmatium sp. JEL0117]
MIAAPLEHNLSSLYPHVPEYDTHQQLQTLAHELDNLHIVYGLQVKELAALEDSSAKETIQVRKSFMSLGRINTFKKGTRERANTNESEDDIQKQRHLANLRDNVRSLEAKILTTEEQSNALRDTTNSWNTAKREFLQLLEKCCVDNEAFYRDNTEFKQKRDEMTESVLQTQNQLDQQKRCQKELDQALLLVTSIFSELKTDSSPSKSGGIKKLFKSDEVSDSIAGSVTSRIERANILIKRAGYSEDIVLKAPTHIGHEKMDEYRTSLREAIAPLTAACGIVNQLVEVLEGKVKEGKEEQAEFEKDILAFRIQCFEQARKGKQVGKHVFVTPEMLL